MTGRWPFDRNHTLALSGGLLLGLVIRAILLPTPGMTGDLESFVKWVHHISLSGLPHAYDEPLSFPPVMAYVWALLAAVEPAFRTVTDSSDPAIRVLMKLPATLADYGIAMLIAYFLRDRPTWAVVAAVAFVLHPGVIDISAWWGQYESIYLVAALAAAILAVNGRNGWAAALIAVSLMTKPQALPMLVPFAAWFWAQDGWRGLVRATVIGAVTILVLWLPFIPAGGPANYLNDLAFYQGEQFAVLSIWGWNIWWLVEEAAGHGEFITDNGPFIGPLTLRHVGFLITAVLELAVAVAVIRDPRPKTFVLALAGSILVAFAFLTAMHERYSYGAVVFLMLLIPDLRLRWIGIVFGVVFTLNQVAAVPPTPDFERILHVSGLLGVVGSIVMLGITAVVYWMLAHRRSDVASP
jgi:Gpi18-like mannosyltransferase